MKHLRTQNHVLDCNFLIIHNKCTLHQRFSFLLHTQHFSNAFRCVFAFHAIAPLGAWVWVWCMANRVIFFRWVRCKLCVDLFLFFSFHAYNANCTILFSFFLSQNGVCVCVYVFACVTLISFVCCCKWLI